MKIESELFEDEEFEKYKQKRMKELNTDYNRSRLLEIYDEYKLIEKSKKDTMIVHFYSDDFKKCKIMNNKLEKVAPHFKDIEFIKINAQIAPVLVNKLNIKVLPFLGFFKAGYFIFQAIGFEGFGDDDFDPEDLINFIGKTEIMNDIK